MANGKAKKGVCPGYCCLLGTKCLLVYDISRHLPAETLPQNPAGPDGATLSLSPSRKTISEAGSTAFATWRSCKARRRVDLIPSCPETEFGMQVCF